MNYPIIYEIQQLGKHFKILTQVLLCILKLTWVDRLLFIFTISVISGLIRTHVQSNWMSPFIICILFLFYMNRSQSIIKGRDGNGTSHFFVVFFMFKVKAHALGIRIKSRETKTEQYYCVCVCLTECILNKRDCMKKSKYSWKESDDEFLMKSQQSIVSITMFN